MPEPDHDERPSDEIPPTEDDLIPPDDDGPRRASQPLITPLPLDWIREHADAMTDIGVPGHMLDAYPPDEFLPMNVLRALLELETIPLDKRDAVWRYLIGNAIEQRGRWYVYVIGVAAMKLLGRVDRLTPGGQHGDRDDKRHVHQHLAVGFIAEMHRVKPEHTRLNDRVFWRAVSRAKRSWWNNTERDWPPQPGQAEPPAEPKNTKTAKAEQAPDDELVPALRALVVATEDVKPSRTDRRPKITAQDAALVALCSLYGRTITEAAEELGMSADAARSKLPSIKRAVFTLLASDHLRGKLPEWTTG